MIVKLSKSSKCGIQRNAEEETLRRAHEDEQEGKSPSTQAGEFVREEIHHAREGKHGARNTKQSDRDWLDRRRAARE